MTYTDEVLLTRRDKNIISSKLAGLITSFKLDLMREFDDETRF